jgi:hypothetical protein
MTALMAEEWAFATTTLPRRRRPPGGSLAESWAASGLDCSPVVVDREPTPGKPLKTISIAEERVCSARSAATRQRESRGICRRRDDATP